MSENDNQNQIVVGGPEYDANDDYIKSLCNLFYKINSAGDDFNEDILNWKLDYYVNILINRIIDPESREIMRDAKESLFLIEKDKIRKEKDIRGDLPVRDRCNALIKTNQRIFGELITYFDKYYGFETKLAVML